VTTGRPSSPGASRARLAAWQTRRLEAVRGRPASSFSYDDELPIDLLADPEETRRILDRLRSCEHVPVRSQPAARRESTGNVRNR